MKRKLFVAFLAAVFNLSVAITILAHCGSTWITQAPSFGPQLGSNGCTQQDQLTTTLNQFPQPYIGPSVYLVKFF